MKKIITTIMASVMLACSVSSCTTGAAAGKKKIVTTIFPEYDWVMNILGDKADQFDITLLMDSGTDLHSFQPTVTDLATISDCDLFIYVGGESDGWAEDAVAQATNKDMEVINLMEVLGSSAVEEELVEGMEGEEQEEEGEAEEEGPEYDEHVWLSLRNASVLCEAIEDGISKIDPDNKAVYEANLASYRGRLDDLDARYVEVVESAQRDTLLFGDRFPFRYMMEDYGLNYYAAFLGCSAESEASFETIVFLSGKVDELGLDSIMTIEGNSTDIAEAIRDNTESKDQQILTMDSMQSVTAEDIKNGADYIEIMTSNLDVLASALG
jgi:zinc transport system substrate-binding protein